MLVAESRPRTLRWTHAGPLLYGDWGTSRLYVLGLAFLYTAHASVIYLAAIGLLMLAVSWAYTHVCRAFPDGGGVYTAARQLSPTLSVVGATLLLSGYIMTAAISVVEAFHYFGVPHGLTLPLSAVTIILIGGLNWFGAKSAGRFALIVAFAALGVSAVMAVLAIPFFIKGVATIEFSYFTRTPPFDAWVAFTSICLALAGVEAVANMTGLMTKPVAKTSKRTIWPVTVEVVVLNMIFGIALAGLGLQAGFRDDGSERTLANLKQPDAQRLPIERAAFIEEHGVASPAIAALDPHSPIRLEEQALAELSEEARADYTELDDYERAVESYTTASMKVIAQQAGTEWFGQTPGFIIGKVAGITFGLLLLSATNTAVMAMVSVLFAMGQDRELPRGLTKLNFSGVPWVGLIVSVIVPIAVVSATTDVTLLAKLYVLGVCGAITVTLLSTALNKSIELGPRARLGMTALGVFLLAVTLTIGVTQPISTAFSGGLVAIALISRAAIQAKRRVTPQPIEEPHTGWLAQVETVADGKLEIDPDSPKIMLAARGRYQAEFAVDLARKRHAVLFVIFVRAIRVLDMRPGVAPDITQDADAQQALGSVVVLGQANGVPVVPIYVTATEIAPEILDYTVTYGCQTIIMGQSKRSLFSRRFAGDIVQQVADDLPDTVELITRSADTPHAAKGLVVPTAATPWAEAQVEDPADPSASGTDDDQGDAAGQPRPSD